MPGKHGLNAHIFREYDIRGIVAQDLTPATCGADRPRVRQRAARAQRRRDDLVVAIGRDNRPSSPVLAGVIRGMRAAGVNVIDYGTVPTPVLYYAAARTARTAACRSPARTTRRSTTASR
jgi:phosphomannomutase / phosphoglucomutase